MSFDDSVLVSNDSGFVIEMNGFVRTCVLTEYRTLVSEMGGDPDSLLRDQRIDPDLLRKDDNLIALESHVRLLDATAEQLHCPTFGLRLSERQGFQAIGPIALIGLNSNTVEEALNKMLDAMHFHSSAVLCTIDRMTDPSRPRITFDVELGGVSRMRQIYEAGLGHIYQELKVLTEGRFIPSAILIRHPPITDVSIYEDYFGTRVYFEQDINAVVVTPDVLRTRIDNANPQLQKLAMEFVRQANVMHPTDIIGQVRFLLRQFLPAATCGIKDVAAHLCMHERTLQRKLKKDGVTYEDLLEAARAERAEELLKYSNMPMLQISLSLGYHEQSSFTHACLRWFGMTPSKVRQRSLESQTGWRAPVYN